MHRSIAAKRRSMDSEFYRIQRLPPYVFAEVNAMKAAARARGPLPQRSILAHCGIDD